MEWARPLDLLEAAYRLDGSDDDWVGGLVGAAAKVFRHEGVGAGGFVLRGSVDEAGRTVIADIAAPRVEGRAICRRLEPHLRTFFRLPAEVQSSLWFSSTLASTMSERTWVGDDLPAWLETSGFDSSVARDALGLACHDGTTTAAFVGVGLRRRTTLNDRERNLGERIATHIGAALRLRSAARSSPETAEAVLSPNGVFQHLARSPDATTIKKGFARRRHARRRDVDPETALGIWQGLHDGRWSLVDYVDTDGKAFVLAVRNAPARHVASTLTDGQRAVVALAALGYGNKQVAYALGLTAAAVAMLLARARAATGLCTRADLVRAFKRSLAGCGS